MAQGFNLPTFQEMYNATYSPNTLMDYMSKSNEYTAKKQATDRAGRVMGIEDALAAQNANPLSKLQVYSPDQANKIDIHNKEMEARLLSGVAKAPNPELAYKQALAYMAKNGQDISELPSQWSPEAQQAIAMRTSLGADYNTGLNREFQAGQNALNRSHDFAKLNYANQLSMGLEGFKSQLKASERSLSPLSGDAAKTAMNLRKEIKPKVDAYREVGNAYNRMLNVSENPSAAGDLSLVFNYMKMLDPGSVVRESEFRNAENAKAWFDENNTPNWIRTAYQKAKTGQFLTPEQRQDFLNQADNLFKAQSSSFNADTEFYRRIAQDSGVDPSYVINDPFQDLRKEDSQNRGSQASGMNIGEVSDGYRYLGGDPNNQSSWEKI